MRTLCRTHTVRAPQVQASHRNHPWESPARTDHCRAVAANGRRPSRAPVRPRVPSPRAAKPPHRGAARTHAGSMGGRMLARAAAVEAACLTLRARRPALTGVPHLRLPE